MKSFAIHTLGCKVNAFESESYVLTMKKAGYIQKAFNEKADIYIINSCAITNTASAKTRQKINQALHQNEDALICVIGCMVQVNEKNINADMRIDVLIGSSHKNELLQHINKAIDERKQQIVISDVLENPDFDELIVDHFDTHTRAFLKIQDGCDQFCTYCIIPYARGKERSLAPEKVLTQAKQLINSGHNEIVLSGIHTGRYGKEYNMTLADLIRELLKTDVQRIRISSIEITEVTDELIALMKDNKRIARHLHIPMQSGSDKILKLMGRPYDTSYFENKIEQIRTSLNDISISTDIIVGFAQESDDDFNDTYNFALKMAFSFIHVFPFSLKTKTLAAQLDQQVSEIVKKERVKRLLDLSAQLNDKYNRSFIEKEVQVIFESSRNNEMIGYTSEYLSLKVKCTEKNPKKLYNVRVSDYIDRQLHGYIIKE